MEENKKWAVDQRFRAQQVRPFRSNGSLGHMNYVWGRWQESKKPTKKVRTIIVGVNDNIRALTLVGSEFILLMSDVSKAHRKNSK